jgi:hypothetical protein
MKHFSFLLLVIVFFISCKPDKKDPVVIKPGIYKGQFYHTSPYIYHAPSNVTLTFTDQRFSGTSDQERFPAICRGAYKMADHEIEFVNECPWTADFDWNYILNGKYKAKITGNSLELTKQSGNDIYQYKLEKQ